jgi:hypothetical protein
MTGTVPAAAAGAFVPRRPGTGCRRTGRIDGAYRPNYKKEAAMTKVKLFKVLSVLATVYAAVTGAILAIALVVFLVSSAASLIGLAIQALPVAAAAAVALWAAGKSQGVSTKDTFTAVKSKAADKLAGRKVVA